MVAVMVVVWWVGGLDWGHKPALDLASWRCGSIVCGWIPQSHFHLFVDCGRTLQHARPVSGNNSTNDNNSNSNNTATSNTENKLLCSRSRL